MTKKFSLFQCLIALLMAFSATPLFSATLPANFAEQAIGGTWNEAAGLTFAAALAYLAGAYESRNLWDYLIDPLVSFYALARLLAGVRHRPSNELGEAAPAA